MMNPLREPGSPTRSLMFNEMSTHHIVPASKQAYTPPIQPAQTPRIVSRDRRYRYPGSCRRFCRNRTCARWRLPPEPFLA